MYEGKAKFEVPFGLLGKCLDYLNENFGAFKVEKINGVFKFKVRCGTPREKLC